MRIGMQTWGSHGDIRPFLALAEGLQENGYEVTLAITCVDSDKYGKVESKAGVNIINVASPVITDAADMQRAGEAILDQRNPVRQARNILTMAFEPAVEAMAKVAEQLCHDNDVLIGHFFHYPLQAWAEKMHKPYISVLLQHNFLPTLNHAPYGMPAFINLSPRFSWWLVRKLMNSSMKSYPNRFRATIGLPPVKDLIDDVWTSEALTLIGVSRHLCLQQQDWPETYRVCGFLDMPNIELEGELSDNLLAFLNKGTPPIYMTFGSLMPPAIEAQKKTIELFMQAAQKSDCRAIIQAPDATACGYESSDTVCFVDKSPYETVFPHCAAVVHHGGAGTTQTASLAGKPSVVVAHIAEQEFWGAELQRAGLAGPVLLRRKVNASELARAIVKVKESFDIQRQAHKLGAAMRRENGVASAVELINDFSASIV